MYRAAIGRPVSAGVVVNREQSDLGSRRLERRRRTFDGPRNERRVGLGAAGQPDHARFQQFDLRPTDETETRFTCNGCAPWTVDLTAYAPGKFDPTEARKGKPVTVIGDGFLVEDQAKHSATLTWQYAENAWATVRGMTSATIELDRMVELAHALQPAERTPIRLPLSLPNLPDEIPWHRSTSTLIVTSPRSRTTAR
jgi:hypothetical protein